MPWCFRPGMAQEVTKPVGVVTRIVTFRRDPSHAWRSSTGASPPPPPRASRPASHPAPAAPGSAGAGPASRGAIHRCRCPPGGRRGVSPGGRVAPAVRRGAARPAAPAVHRPACRSVRAQVLLVLVAPSPGARVLGVLVAVQVLGLVERQIGHSWPAPGRMSSWYCTGRLVMFCSHRWASR